MTDLAHAWDLRVEVLLRRLPNRGRSAVQWLRDPSRRLVRIAAALFFMLGGCLSILPVLGLWMLPLGLALLAEDVPGLKAPLERAACWIERTYRRIRGRTPPPPTETPRRP